jgi:iron complex outermembrane receptor protein
MKTLHCSSAIVALLSSGVIAPQALAQAAQNEPGQTKGGLEEIVVTAQRRAEALEDVPMSISVVTAEALEASGVTNIHDIGQIASGVQMNWAGAFSQPSIRGVTSLTNGYGENNVAIYIDGFYEPSTVSINQDLANIESIQVLKGPQGALYGRNATGGAILISTLSPSETLTGLAEVTYGRFDDKRFKGYISGPISDMLSFSLAGYYRESDGYLEFADPAAHLPPSLLPNGQPNPTFPSAQALLTGEDAAPIEQRLVRAKLQAKFTEDITATLALNYAYSDIFNGNLYTTYEHRLPTLPPAAKPGEVTYNYDTIQLAKTHQATLKLEWDMGPGTLTSYSSYGRIENPLRFDFDGTYADLTYSTAVFHQYTKQQTFDFALTAVTNLDLIVGASFINDDIHVDLDNPSINYGPGKTVTTVTYQGLEAESWAAYVDGTYHLTDKLSLSAGARYTDERKNGHYEQFNVLTNVATFAPTNKRMSFNKLTPRASIRYELAPQTNVYASYSKGFRSGTLSLSGAATPELWLPVAPELIDAYEIGFKTAGGIARFDIAAFYYDYKDIHVSVLRPDPRCVTPANPQGLGCTVLTVFQNAEGAEIYGVDGNLTVSPTESLNIRVGAAWLHARYTDFDNASGNALNPATDLNVGGTIQDWSDKEMARSPEFSANLGADYNWQLPFGGLLFAANARYSDSFVINNPSLIGGRNATTGVVYPGDEQRYREDSMVLVNASLTWTAPGEHFSIGAFGNNLTDEEYRVTYSGGLFGDYGVLAEPMTYGMRAGYKF